MAVLLLVDALASDSRPVAEKIHEVDAEAPQVRVTDLGITRGDGIFEAFGCVDGEPQAVEAHFARLRRSAEALELPALDYGALREAVFEGARRHPAAHELLIKLIISRGAEEKLGPDLKGGVPTAWVRVTVEPDETEHRRGIKAITLDRGYRHDVAQTSPWLLQGAKTLSYAVNRSVQRYALEHGADDVIFTSSDGYVLEGPSSSLVAVFGQRAVTPRTDQGILAGTTQGRAFEFFSSRGFETAYDLIPVADLPKADTIWLLSSGRQSAPVVELDGKERNVDRELSDALLSFLLTHPGI